MTKSASLEKGLLVLNLLDGTEQPLGIREIARRLSMAPAVTQRMVSTLSEYNYVTQDPDSRKYKLGYRALSLGSNMLSDDALVSSAMPELRRLADLRNLNCYLGVVQRNSLVYVLAVQSSGPVAIRSAPGTVSHFHSTAMGKALLAATDEETARALLGSEPLAVLTSRTMTEIDAVLDDLGTVRRTGFATSIEENLPGIHGVGAVVRDASGKAVAGLSVAYSPQISPQQTIEAAARLVTEAADNVSRRLGCPLDRLINAV